MRAVVNLINCGFVNIPGDSIERDNEWFIVKNKGELVGAFDEGEVKSIHLSDRKKEVKQNDNP